MRFAPLSPALALLAITVSGAFIHPGAARASGRSAFAASAPQGFEALAAEREVVLDAYFAGRKLGEVRARLSPGLSRFNEPEALAALVPDVADRPAVVEFLSGPLATNAAKACGPGPREGCGMLPEGQFGVIVDEERFRVDLLVSPNLLIRPDPLAERFLPAPPGAPSLISLFGLTASGSSRGGDTLHFQNRAIASVGRMRLRSDSSISTDTGLTFDNLTLESDRANWRYLAGLFWAPGSELIGRRKIVGAGIATQLDTRQNKEELLGTPVSIFLQQPAKVDLLVDGRIIASRIYPAGNRLVDTASLPNGSYELVVRIQEDGRPPREEQRFFSKGSAMAPAGRPLLSVFAGLIPSSSSGLSLRGDDLFYQASAAYRLSPALGLDAALLGTQHKAILEGGATYHLPWAQLRVGALLSSGADYGALLRFNSVSQGPWSFSFDLRKIVSRRGGPLLPVTRSRGTFSEDPDSGFADRGSFTQALSIIGYRIGQANVRLTGLYRRNGSEKADYSIGGAVDVPVLRTGRFDIVLQADARRSDW
jgi:Mat/Ecp fimbriae outer membrane usher protein